MRVKGGLSLAFAALVIVLALWLPTSSALAAGGGIGVVRSDWELDFPDDLSFALTMESEQDIAEVRLIYRAKGRDVWSYAYSDFSPGPRTIATLNLSINGSAYVPPGTELEYYYLITDVGGNVHRTDPEVIEIIDQRFQWDRTKVDSLLLLHHDLSSSKVAAATQEIEAALDRIRGLLGVETGRPMKGVIYNSNAEARDAFPWHSQTISDAQVFGGFAFPPLGVFVGVGFGTRIISHEAAHILLEQALGERALPLPAWLDEGFANYVEPGSYHPSGRSLGSRGLPLRAMTTVSGTPRSIVTFYEKAGSVVFYLIEEFGADSFRRLIGELAQGRAIDDALVSTYGFDTSQLEARWVDDGAGSPGPKPRRSPSGGTPWASFSSLVMGALAVVVSLYVVFRYFVRRLRPAQAPEEGLQPWEDPDWEDPDVVDDWGEETR